MKRIGSGGSRGCWRLPVVALATAALAAVTTASLDAARTSQAESPAPAVRIAYLSFAIASSYDASMPAAAQAAAAKGGAELTVFDAKGSQRTQLSQLQAAASSKDYDAIVLQPTSGTALVNVIAGSDQSIEGAVQAVDTSSVTLVGYGGSEAGLEGVATAKWYGTIMKLPATEGRLAVQCAIKAVRTRTAAAATIPPLRC